MKRMKNPKRKKRLVKPGNLTLMETLRALLGTPPPKKRK